MPWRPGAWGLRARLNLLLSLVFLAALVIAAVYLVANARRAIADELDGSGELASLFILGMRDSVPDATAPAGLLELVERMAAHDSLRHLRITLIDAAGREMRGLPVPRHAWVAPAWFRELMRPARTPPARVLDLGTARLHITADPDAEIDEAWRDVRVNLLVLCLAFAGATVATFVFLGRVLQPLHQLSRGLEGVERGQYAVRLAPSGVPDLDGIVTRFNDMTSALEQSERDNAALARRSMAIQEDERRHLAHELHDELGQSITAIKALAVAIRQRADGVLAERAGTIIDVSSDVYARVRRMMSRLRPPGLDELGLVPALEAMIDDWNDHHEDCFCEFVAPRDLPSLDAELRIAAYRAVQEALTNVARHAGARSARVALGWRENAHEESTLELEITDNGRGFVAEETRAGLGLRGMRERVQASGGTMELHAAPGAGVRIVIHFPLIAASTATAATAWRRADVRAKEV